MSHDLNAVVPRASGWHPGFWRERRVFITGCTGFLGSWLAHALLEAGASVVGLVRDEVAFSQLRRSGDQGRMALVRGDVTDYELLERALNEYEVDAIFHLAAQTIVTIANRSPLSTFDTNIRGTWTVLEAARRAPKVTRIVTASSDKAYGEHLQLPYTEDAPLLGRHPYDVSKSCADMIARAYATTFGMPVAVTRCSNLYGGGDLNWSRIVPGTVRSLLHGERPIIRSDGTLRRDYLYVQDAVSAYIALAEQLDRAEVRGQAFNFGMDAPLTVLEMVEAIVAVSEHPDLQPVIEGHAPNEIQEQYLASDKALHMLGWAPAFTLEEGLRETTAWYRAFLAER